MNRDVETHLAEIDALCRCFGVRRLALFGSAMGERFHEGESDLDFLVEFESPDAPGYADRYFGLMEALQALFGRSVDLVVESAIQNPYCRESVERSRALLYAA